MKKDDIVKYLLSIAALISTCFGIYFYFDKEFAHAKDFRLLQQRVFCGEINQQYSSVRDRVWKLEDRYGIGCASAPESVKEEYRKNVEEKEQLDKLLEDCLRQ